MMPDNHVFTATVASNVRTEKCEAPDWETAKRIFESKLQPGESVIEMTDKTLCPGGGEMAG